MRGEARSCFIGHDNRALAHTPSPNEAYRGKARVAMYGDERRVMEWTMPLAERANDLIGYAYVRGGRRRRR